MSLTVRNNSVRIDSKSKIKISRAVSFLEERLGIRNGKVPACVDKAHITVGRKHNVRACTGGQVGFLEAVRSNDLVFAIGPAGTGKTFLAVAMAIDALRSKMVEKIVLVRPAVEAGESLGFLPGNLKEKVDPYLAPLYDALHEILPRETVTSYFSDRTIEVSPIAYMRGRTLHNSFVILDEAQNATLKQLKMFLTRLGTGSKAVVCGDITQIDLKNDGSGLRITEKLLKNLAGTAFVYLDENDIMRHKLVRDIIRAYDEYERKNG